MKLHEIPACKCFSHKDRVPGSWYKEIGGEYVHCYVSDGIYKSNSTQLLDNLPKRDDYYLSNSKGEKLEMTNTITLTDKQMKALQSGQSITIEPPKPTITKWEPKGGDYRVQSDLTIFKNQSSRDFKNSGIEYKTQAQAEQAAKALRSYARQLAWLAENDDGWAADWNNFDKLKFYVYYIHRYGYGKWYVSHDCKFQSSGIIYMSKDNAEKLCQLLNAGIVEF